MAQTTVKQLASETGIPVERLVSRLAEAGVEARSAEDQISDEDKLKLLSHLRNAESARSGGKLGAKRSSVSLRRRSTSELKVNTGRGSTSGRTVNVEVRKRRTFDKGNEQTDEEPARPQTVAQVGEQDRQRRRDSHGRWARSGRHHRGPRYGREGQSDLDRPSLQPGCHLRGASDRGYTRGPLHTGDGRNRTRGARDFHQGRRWGGGTTETGGACA